MLVAIELHDTGLFLDLLKYFSHWWQNLLDFNANIDTQDDNGRTALMFSANQGNVSILKLLLENSDFLLSAKDTFYHMLISPQSCLG